MPTKTTLTTVIICTAIIASLALLNLEEVDSLDDCMNYVVGGRWISQEDSSNYIVFEKNNQGYMMHSIWDYPIAGRVDIHAEYEFDCSVVPHKIVYYITSILMDGRISTVGPQPGDELYGIFKKDDQRECLTINVNAFAYGDYPQDYDDSVYVCREN